MIRTSLITAAILVILVPSSAAADQSVRRQARLQASGAPNLVLRGTQFLAGERVTVTVQAGRRVSRRTVASAAGRFTVQFPFAFDRCNSDLIAIAIGNRGSRARAKLPQLMCPPRL